MAKLNWQIFTESLMCTGDKVVVSDIRGPRFESRHRPYFCTLDCSKEENKDGKVQFETLLATLNNILEPI